VFNFDVCGEFSILVFIHFFFICSANKAHFCGILLDGFSFLSELGKGVNNNSRKNLVEQDNNNKNVKKIKNN
jgi:hypothetical protein